MKKHKFNIFPELSPDEYKRTLEDIRAKGYDSSFPVVTYQGDIIDGWNRQRACDELGITPAYRVFEGNDAEAVEYVMRSNKRRNLKKGQWACLAAEADDLIEAIRADVEKSRREKQAETLTDTLSGVSDKKLSQTQDDEHADTTATKVAELFNTNRTYVNKAIKLKKENPKQFDRVKSGEISMSKAGKADARSERLNADFEIAVKKLGMEEEVANGNFSKMKQKVVNASLDAIKEIAEMKRIGEITFASCAKMAKMPKADQKKAVLGGVYGVNQALGHIKKGQLSASSRMEDHIPSDGKSCAVMAIIKLDRILDTDSEFEWAMNHIIAYCENRMNTKTNNQ